MSKKYNHAKSILDKYESRSMHGQLPIYWKSAKNSIVKDQDNKRYIDFTSTIFVANIGHSNPYIKRYIRRVLRSNLIHSYTYLNKFRVEYIQKLVEFAGNPFEKAYLASSGTEATETALKLIRLYSNRISKKNKPGIISFNGNYHGRTLGSFMMSGFEKSKSWIGYHDPNIFFIDFPYPWDVSEEQGPDFFVAQLEGLKKKGVNLKTDIGGFMIETFQGWGALFYPKSFIKKLASFAKENDILICFDEMQAGFFRTGKKFGFLHYEVDPDIICIGKGMGGGMPISGVLSTKQILDLPSPGEMSSTNSANPLVCAGALATLDYIKDYNISNHALNNSKLFQSELNKISTEFKSILKIYGKGMISAILFYDKKGNPDIDRANKVVDYSLNNGLIVVKTGRESIKLGPPVNISKKNLLKGIQILRDSIIQSL